MRHVIYMVIVFLLLWALAIYALCNLSEANDKNWRNCKLDREFPHVFI